MTKIMRKFLNIRNGINSGNLDEMKLFDFIQSLNSKQARDLMSDVCSYCHNPQDAETFCKELTKWLREDVVIELIREDLKDFADMGFGTLSFDNDGNIDAIHIDNVQGKRLLAFQKFLKGGEA